MKERPILFNAEMVRAILDGTKTQTRRLVKPNAGHQGEWLEIELINKSPKITTAISYPSESFGAQIEHPQSGPLCFVKCPYGAPGDQLWVRETHYLVYAQGNPNNHVIEIDYKADANHTKRLCPQKWRPSIHMPRSASRIQLEILGVRVERLKAISETDSLAEGVIPEQISTDVKRTAYSEFKNLWCSTYGGESWDENPWVWVIEFKRIEQ